MCDSRNDQERLEDEVRRLRRRLEDALHYLYKTTTRLTNAFVQIAALRVQLIAHTTRREEIEDYLNNLYAERQRLAQKDTP